VLVTAAHLTDAQMLAAIEQVQARHTVHATDPGALGEEPGERVVSADLDEHREQADDNRRWGSWP
jgi:hypothetical protein